MGKTGLTAIALCLTAGSAVGQVPTNLETLELARSRECVSVLARLDALDSTLAPLAARSRRLATLAQAIALEDEGVAGTPTSSDPVDAAVAAWFARDAEFARQYLAQPSPALLEQRTAAREAIKQTVTAALTEVQAEANQRIEAAGELGDEAARCDGAVFVRSAVLEACQATASPVCGPARDTVGAAGPFRFVESADALWDVQELRAWSQPTPFQVANGQIGGARTVGVTRTGNVVVTLAFGPLLQRRASLTPDAQQLFRTVADSLGYGNAHPDVVFAPSLAILATISAPLDGETGYLFHFGEPEQADVVWATDAGTGSTIEGAIPLRPGHLARLRAGDPLTLTAIRDTAPGEADALYAIELTSIGQANAVGALVGYMSTQLAGELQRFFPPGAPQGGAGTPPPQAPPGR